MKAFLIDPESRTINEVDYDGDYTSIYSFIDAQTFATAMFNQHGDTVFVDDEGLFRTPTAFFQVTGYPQPMAGKGLVLGCDMDTGDTVECTATLEWLRNHVQWLAF